MRKLLKSLLVSTLFPTILLAQTEYREGQAHVDADRGIMCLGVDGSGNYVPTNLAGISPGTGATNLGKAEDAAHTTGDVGIACLGFASAIPQTATAGEGDYVLPKTNLSGAQYVDVNINGQVNNGNGLLKFEDAASADSVAGVAGLAVRQDTISNTVGSDLDYGLLKQDNSGALWTQGATSSMFRSIDLDESEEEVSATATRVTGYFLYNNTASVLFVKFYNATAANTTVGTTTPTLTIPIPPNSGANVGFANPLLFSTALSAAATTGVADADTGAPAANALIANIFYR